MQTVRKLKLLIVFYLGVLVCLLLAVIAMPLVIQHGLSITRTFIIKEEILEACLIIILFGISYFILRGFKGTLKAYECAVSRAVEQKSKLSSRLSEAFSYIGNVNVELHEFRSILCGVERYPQTKREFKQVMDDMAEKAMTVAGSAWAVIRMINRSSGRTIREYHAVRPKGSLPKVTLGNREILEDRNVKGLSKINSRQKNLDLLTVCILPTSKLTEQEKIMITAITNQIEMLFLIWRTGLLN